MAKRHLALGLTAGMLISAVAIGGVNVSAHRGENLSDEERTALQEQRQADRADKLQAFFDSNSIEDDDRARIEAFFEKMQALKQEKRDDRPSSEEWQAMSEDERQEFKQAYRDEFVELKAEGEELFESLGIEKSDIFDRDGKRGKHGRHGQRFERDSDAQSDQEVEPAQSTSVLVG